MGKRVKRALLGELQAAEKSGDAARIKKAQEQWSSYRKSHKGGLGGLFSMGTIAKPMKLMGKYLHDPTTDLAKATGNKKLLAFSRSQFNPFGAWTYTGQTLGKELSRPGGATDWKSFIQSTKRAHQEALEPQWHPMKAQTKEKQWNQIYGMLQSKDPNVRAQGKKLWMIQKNKAERDAQNATRASIAATAAVAGGEAAFGQGAGAATDVGNLGDIGGQIGGQVGDIGGQIGDIGGQTGGLLGTGTPEVNLGEPTMSTPPSTPSTPPSTPWYKYLAAGAPAVSSLLSGKGKGAGAGGAGLGGIGQLETQVGEQLLKDYQSGTIPEADKTAIDSFVNQQKEQTKQYLINAGIPLESTTAIDMLGAIDKEGVTMFENFRNQTLQNGLAALNPAAQISTNLMQQQIAKDQATQQAWSNAANTAMMLFAMS